MRDDERTYERKRKREREREREMPELIQSEETDVSLMREPSHVFSSERYPRRSIIGVDMINACAAVGHVACRRCAPWVMM
jgi:hypothetical protein